VRNEDRTERSPSEHIRHTNTIMISKCRREVGRAEGERERGFGQP
jgi:hypothetical protein